MGSKWKLYACSCGQMLLKVNTRTGIIVTLFHVSGEDFVECPSCEKRSALPDWSPLSVRKFT